MEKDKIYKRNRSGRIVGGLFIIAIGVISFLKQLGIEFPDWLFTWKMGLIVIGLFIGVKHGFRHFGWLPPIIIGGLFLVEDFMPEINIKHFIWPLLLIIAGAHILIPRRHNRCYSRGWRRHWHHEHDYEQEIKSEEDFINSVSIFGGVKKIILSKNFKGGDIVAVFGGAEINLSQADINGKAVLEVAAVFGGIKIIIPPHWEVKSEVVAILGGIEDKRPLRENTNNPDKILVIRGAAVFGGIDIKSF